MKTKHLFFAACLIAIAITTKAQIKVTTGGKASIGYAGTPPSKAQTHLVKNSVFSKTSSGTGAMIKGNDSNYNPDKPDYTWYSDTTTGIFHPVFNVIGFSINGYEKLRMNSSGKLHIFSSADATKPEYSWKGDSTTGFFLPATKTLGFTTDGSEKMRISSNGRVGIGTTSPQELLQIGDRFTFHNGGTKYIGYNSYYDGTTNKRLVADYASAICMGGGDIYFNLGVSAAVGDTIIFTNALHIKNNGKIGIGNNTPAYKLDVNGDINVPSSTSYGYRIGGNIILTQRSITSSLFVGNGSGNSNTASNITAIGYKALYSNTSGTPNNAFGAYALYSNTTGIFNLAIGDSALYTNTSSSNAAIGTSSLLKNTTGSNNTAVGIKSAYSNTTGVANSIFGFTSLFKNTAGSYNCAFGYQALFNSTNSYNSAFGAYALFTNTTGDYNISIGHQSLYNSSTGDFNTATGYTALHSNSTGSSNTGVGYGAGQINTTGSNNTFFGYQADANGANYTNATAIGNGAIVTATNKIRVGNTAITHIGGQPGWTTYSDGRFKTDIQENVKGLEFIRKLRPVTYRVNTAQLDDYLIQNMPDSIKQMHKVGMDFTASSAIIHSGFIAQEVEQAALQVEYANTIVSTPSNATDLYGITYGELVVPLVKAMQEQSIQVDSLTTITHKLDSINRLLQNQINEIVNNCCERKITPTTTDRNINSSIDLVYNAQNNWLTQNKPNPFNKETLIEYNVIQEGKGNILIFDMNGKLLKTIPVKIPGKGSIIITASDLAAGMYYYTLVVNDAEVDTKKMILTE